MHRKRIISFILAITLVFGDVLSGYAYEDVSGNDDIIQEFVEEPDVSASEYYDTDEVESESDEDLLSTDCDSNVFDVVPVNDDSQFYGYRPVNRNYNLGDIYEYGSDYEGLTENKFDSLQEKYIPEFDSVPALRNQGDFGTCWAHAAMTNAEFSMLKKSLVTKYVDYSELQLAYFTYNTVTDPLGGTAGDYNSAGPGITDIIDMGGNSVFVGPVLATWAGVVSEDSDSRLKYSYAATAQSIGLPDELSYLSDSHLQNYYIVDITEEIDATKELILENGAISIAFFVPNSIDAYYDSTYNSFYYPGSLGTTNHAVSVVGWDDTFPKEHFKTTAPADGAWLVRNSWKASYNAEESFYGYFWMSYYDGTLEDRAYAFEFESADNYDNNYQYDGSMDSEYIYAKDDFAAANIFTVKANEATDGDNVGEKLRAVSFATSETNLEYSVKIYKNPNPGIPESGTLLNECTTTGVTTYAGYYTIELNGYADFYFGDTFSVVISIHKAGSYPDFLVECTSDDPNWWYNTNAHIEEGQSFAKEGKGAWYDLANSGLGNVRIKAFTTNGTNAIVINPESVTLTNIANNALTLNRTDTFSIDSEVWPANATSKGLNYSSSDGSVASVDKYGTITAYKKGTTTITVSTKLGDASASFVLTVNCPSTSIILDGDEVIEVGKLVQYAAKFNETNEVITGCANWSTSDDSILYVEDNEVYAINIGTATLTVECDGISQSKTVVVKPVLSIDQGGVTTLSWPAKEGVSFYRVIRKGYGEDYIFPDITNPLSGDVVFVDESLEEVYEVSTVDYVIESYTNDTIHNDSNITVVLGTSYSITYVMGIGTNNVNNPTMYRSGMDEFVLLNPSNVEGYTFEGWYSDSKYKNKITKAYTSSSTGNITIYAYYKANQYSINLLYPFLEDGDLRAFLIFDHTTTVEYGSAINILGKTIPSGYKTGGYQVPSDTIVGWYKESRCVTDEDYRIAHPELEVKNGDIFTEIELDTVYAVFKKEKVTLDGNGIELGNQYFYVWKYGKYGSLKYYNPTRPYGEMLGWFTASEGGKQVTEDSIFKDVNATKLYAQWDMQKYVLIFNPGEGVCDVASKKVLSYGELGELPVPRRYLYNFDGWYYEDEPVNEDTILENETEPITLIAHWTAKDIKVSAVLIDCVETEVERGTRVSLSTVTQGAKIYYTTDSTVGTLENKEDFIVYDEAITIAEPVTIYAFASKTDYWDSDISSWSFTIKFDPEDYGDVTEEDCEEKNIETAEEVPEGLWAAGIDTLVYNGKALIQDSMHVYFGKTMLLAGRDYTVKYTNNIKAGDGTALVTITGKGNYTGIIKEYFTISPLNLESVANAENIITLYNKKAQKGKTKVTAYVNGKVVTLKAGTDFDYAYGEAGYTEPGDYEIEIIGKGNYSGSISFVETITELSLLSKVKVSKIAAQNYTGEEIVPDFKLTDGKTNLVIGEDYEISYKENCVLPGTATITVKGLGKYTGFKTITFKINGTLLSKVKNKGFKSSCEYSGEEVKQNEFFFYIGSEDNKLVEGTDYSVQYTNNFNVGTATVVFTGINGYTGTVKKTFKITGIAIKNAVVDALPQLVFTGNEIKPEPKVVLGEKELVPGTDIVFAYSANTNKGTGKLTIKGINAYTGLIAKSFKISAASISDTEISIASDYSYTKGGTKVIPEISFNGKTLVKGKDFNLTYKNNTKPGIASVSITGKGNFVGKIDKTYTVTEASLENAAITISNITYKNAAGICKPVVAVKDSNGVKLTVGTDYEKTVVYTYTEDLWVKQFADAKKKSTIDVVRVEGDTVDSKDIIPVGTVIRATVTGKGYYGQSTISGTFKYVKADISKATVTVKAQSYTGKAVEPAKADITVKLGGVILEKSDYVIKGYSKNTSKGTGILVIEGLGNYGGIKTVSFKINAKTFNYTVKYDKNGDGVTGTMKDSNFGSWTVLRKNAYKRTGYVFTGWNTEADGSGVSYNNLELFRIKTGIVEYGKNITLYAQWAVKP